MASRSSRSSGLKRRRAEPSAYGAAEVIELRTELLAWWDRGHRAMPWRRERDDGIDEAARDQWAYEVWVSEIMLQQTQVDRVVPYYQTWLGKWPTAEALASADSSDVLAAWSGLGYYRRARFLLEGARQVAEDPPRSRDAWLRVKGVGQYTAAAIASVCFDERVPVVDGNVVRVLARHRALEDKPPDAVFWRLAGQFIGERPGDTNQAMMDLGATVCTKSAPRCDACPLAPTCLGKETPLSYYPFKKQLKSKTTRLTQLVCVLQLARLEATDDVDLFENARFALARVPAHAKRLAGLWQFPTTTLDDNDDDPEARIDAVLLDLGLADAPVLRRRLHPKPISHTITDTRYTIRVAWLVLLRGDDPPGDLAWLNYADLRTKAASSVLVKALRQAKSLVHS